MEPRCVITINPGEPLVTLEIPISDGSTGRSSDNGMEVNNTYEHPILSLPSSISPDAILDIVDHLPKLRPLIPFHTTVDAEQIT